MHSKYRKYHYEDLLTIHVLKCLPCRKHHALIPSFSLPGTSLGTEEVEQYIINREQGPKVEAEHVKAVIVR